MVIGRVHPFQQGGTPCALLFCTAVEGGVLLRQELEHSADGTA